MTPDDSPMTPDERPMTPDGSPMSGPDVPPPRGVIENPQMSSWWAFATSALSDARPALQMTEPWRRPTLRTISITRRQAGECSPGEHLGIPGTGGPPGAPPGAPTLINTMAAPQDRTP